MKNTHKMVASFAGGAALLVALGVVVSFWAFSQIEETAEARNHTTVVINRANDFLSALIGAETGQRGYSLTGAETFLEPYQEVYGSFGSRLEELHKLTSNRAAHKHLVAIAPFVDAKLAEMAHIIALRRNHDMTAVMAAVHGGHGKRLMDSIRDEMGSFIQVEEVALAQHEAEFQSNMHRFLISSLSAACLRYCLHFRSPI